MSVLLTDIWALACDFVYVYRLVCNRPLQVHFTHWLRLALVFVIEESRVQNRRPGIFFYVFRDFTQFPEANSGFVTSVSSRTHPYTFLIFVIL